jgi:hypothetical protein
MADIVLQKDVGDLLTSRIACPITALTAAGTGDNTLINGTAIDRAALGVPRSAKVTVLATATLAASKLLNIGALKVQDSADGSTGWADYALFGTTTYALLTDSGSGGSQSGQVSFGVDLGSAREYVRVAFTPDLNATSVDTAMVVAVIDFAGFDHVPTPA